jgi:hypothetical protein
MEMYHSMRSMSIAGPAIAGVQGKEGKIIARGTQKGKGIAVFTSGGDAQGKKDLV